MKERPILFNDAMVRAILDGRKTQTRRVVKPQPEFVENVKLFGLRQKHTGLVYSLDNEQTLKACPYGQPGDRIWVREATINVEEHGYQGPVYVESEEGKSCLSYGLGPPDDVTEIEPQDLRKRPSIHMPRSYARILLEIVSVRVERLQEISDRGPQNDCTAEGVYHCGMDCPTYEQWHGAGFRSAEKFMYRALWESISGPNSWAVNPWVWVIEFRRVVA